MNYKYLFILFLVFLVGSNAVIAVPVQSTTSVYVSLRKCVAGETACDSIERTHSNAIGGLPGSTDARASQKDPAYGESTGSSQLTGEPGAARLTAVVKTMPGARNGSSNITLQRYTNMSETIQTLIFDGTLIFDQTIPEENAEFPPDGGGQSGVVVEMELFSSKLDSFEAGNTAEENWAAFNTEEPDENQMLANATTDGMVMIVTGQGTKALTMSIELKPGDSIWMFGLLQVIAANGAVVDASLDTRLTLATD